MELRIREATPFDYEKLCQLFDEADELHRNQLPERFQQPNGPTRDKAFILDLLANQTVEIFVAERDEELLGLVQVAVKASPPLPIFVPRCYVVVETLVVRKDFRQQGIGQKLMDMVHHWAISNGASDIELNVFAFNQEANALYQKLGYETISYKMNKSLR